MWLQNLFYAARRLRRSPGFSTAVILILALGIGANTAIFSIVYGVLLKPLPYPSAGQLVAIHEGVTGEDASFPGLPVNANHYLYWCAHNHSFSGIAAMRPESLPLSGAHPEEIGVMEETANLLTVLGLKPHLGRTFSHKEEQPGHNDVVILTDSLWRRRYGADAAILGKSILLDGRPYTVIGILPHGATFSDLNAAGHLWGTNKKIEAFVPFAWNADILEELEGDHNYFAIGRLKPDVSPAAALAELTVLQHAISEETPDKVKYSAAVIPFQEYLIGASRKSLLLLLAAVGAVFLIACVNITNLLLTRAISSEREIAVQIALGSSRARLLLGALSEPAILCAAGCLFGITLAASAIPLLARNMPIEVPRLGEVQVSLAAIAFAAGVSVLAALLCATLPVWRFLHADAEPALRGNARTLTTSRAAKRLRSSLIVAEVAGSVALVVIAGLFVSSIFKLLRVNRGFDASHVLSADIVLPDKQYGDTNVRNAFYERALTQLRSVPGVTSTGLVSVLPLDGDYWGDMVSRIGDNRPRWQRPSAHFRWISPGYFETLHVPLLAGRFLSEHDKGRYVALISRSIAAKVWPHESAIGQKFHRLDPDEPPFEVIGIVDDVRTLELSQPPPPMVYAPYWYRSREVGSFVLRTEQDPASLAATLRQTIWSLDSQVPVPQVRTMNVVVSGSLAARRFERNLLLGFALSALLLAALGIYGVVAYSAIERTHEIGIRMAVGASRHDIYRLILGQGITPVLAGTALGLVFALLASRLIRSLLFEVKTSDPWVAFASAAILIAVGICACLIPSWRAARTEPLQALRIE